LDRSDDGTLPIADIWRRVCAAADELGAPRPSYERIRVLVTERRRIRSRTPTMGETLLDVAFRVQPPEAVVDHLAGIDSGSRRRK
jgi:hypothetical protein